MKTFNILSLPIRLVIHDFAKAFDSPYREYCNEYTVDIPEHLGKGSIRGSDFTDGLAYIEYNCMFHEDIEIRFILNQNHPLKFIYSSQGEIFHSFKGSTQWSKADLYKYLVVASANYNDHVLKIKGGHWIRIHSVEIERIAFYSKVHSYLKEVNQNTLDLFGDVHAKNEFSRSGSYGLNLIDIIRTLNTRAYSGFVRIIHLEAKTLEILAHHVLELNNGSAPTDVRQIMAPEDIAKVQKITRIIADSLHQVPTIATLATTVGLSKNKLQNLFQLLYKQTIHQYLTDTRLEEAKNLLQTTQLPIGEICERVGYINGSHFGRLFFGRYGIYPKALRKLIKESANNGNDETTMN
ncbi:MAG: AraC family transcriptional regulator [Bacteroidota bacterium]